MKNPKKYTKIGSLLAVLLIAVMAFGNIGTAAAQGDPVNFTFASDATWLDQPYFATIRTAVNVRAIPTQVGNTEFFTIPAGGAVQVAARYDGDEWLLVRAWDSQNVYMGRGWMNAMGRGWMNADVANLTVLQSFTPPVLTACAASSGLIQIEVNVRFNDGWADDTQTNDCNLIYEGWQVVEEFHNYWIIRDSNTAANAQVNNTTYTHNGWMWLLEGTGWYGPTTWPMGRGINTDDTGQKLEYPPMASYLAQDKQQVMRENGYQYPIRVNALDGTTFVFAFGAFGESPNSVDRCNFTEPQDLRITGMINTAGNFVSTSVGAVGCRTLILWQLPDNTYQILAFTGARERLEYKRIFLAVLIPFSWDNQQMVDYATAQITAAHLPSLTQVANSGVADLPATIVIQ